MKVSYQCIAGSSPTVLYQGNNLQTLVVSSFIISNSDAGNINVSIFLVAPGGTPSIGNAVVYLVKLAGNSFQQGGGGFVVPPQYSLQVQASGSNVVVATIGGELLTQSN